MVRVLGRNLGGGASNRNLEEFIRLTIESELFDEKFYRSKSGISGKEKGMRHYFARGWQQGLDPSARFSSRQYLELNPDVAASGLNPLYHYLKHGRQEGRPIWFDSPSSRKTRKSNEDTARAAERRVKRINEIPEKQIALARKIFSEDYYLSHYPDIARTGVDPFRHYVEYGWAENRNPSSHFDTAFFLARNPDVKESGECPLLVYAEHGDIKYGRAIPEERIIFNIDPASDEANGRLQSDVRIGVHAHVFYPEVVGEILLSLSALPATAHVRFTTTHSGDHTYVKNFVGSRKPAWSYDVVLCKNAGHDIGPFFMECADLWRSTDYMLHIHTKRSLHTDFGDMWRQYLFDQCVGSSTLVSKILETFTADPRIAVLYPENFYKIKKFVGMNGNEANLAQLCQALGHSAALIERPQDYPAGSMCWLRSKTFLPLVDYLSVCDAFGSSDRIEGTFAHVIERAFAVIPRAQGLTAISYATERRVARDYSEVYRPLPIYRDVVTDRWPRDTARIGINPMRPLAPRTRFFNSASLDIHWIIPSFGPGAGGHMTTFRFVEYFEQCGHRQTVWVQNASNFRAPIDALRAIREHYRPLGDKVFVRFLPPAVEQLSGDVLIATDCWTAYPAAAAPNFKERFYFIQDYEVLFHPAGANQLTAAETYQFGFAALCAGPWLLKKATEHGMWARSWYLAADREYYFYGGAHSKRPKTDKIKIAFYARTNTPRRAVELGLAAFEELAKRDYRFEVHFYGGNEELKVRGYDSINHHIIAPAVLGELYRSCDIGVVFSATNYSLIPLEMMACGLPVVELNTESIRAVFSDDELMMVEPTPRAVADGIGKLIDSPELCARYRDNGLHAASRFSWDDSFQIVETAILERLSELGYLPIDPEKICAPHIATCRKASVFIPVKNGGPFFAKVIDRILNQKTDFDFDFLVIDSGSTDGTLDLLKETAKKDGKFRYFEIPQREFQHGRTRNLGISSTDGEYVAVTTADALPADQDWLTNLVAGFKKGKRVAGVTGRHRAYPEHGPFLTRDIDNSFDRLNLLGDLYSFHDQISSQVYPGGIEWQMTVGFYSDNNSAMSRQVWKLIPYPEIDWGEDMVWAWEVLKLDFEKAYADDAVVYHSHAWDLPNFEDWYAIEGRFWRKHFGFDVAGNPEQELAAWNGRDRIYAMRNKVSATQLERQLKLNQACLRGRARGFASVTE